MSPMTPIYRSAQASAQASALAQLSHVYAQVSREPLTPEDRAAVADTLSVALKLIDPARCRAILVLAVQDADPTQLAADENASESFQHSILCSGVCALVEALCAERFAGLRLEREEGPDYDSTTVAAAAAGLAPTRLQPRSPGEH